MQNIRNPRWLFILNTLPIVALLVLLYGQFNIIKTLMDEDAVRLWKIFGLALGGLGALNAAYALFITVSKRLVHAVYGFVALLCHISFIYIYFYHIGDIIPNTVPNWMISGNVFLYAVTFLMPALAYALLVLVVCFTGGAKERKPWISFLVAIAVPVAGYLFSQIAFPVFDKFFDRLSGELWIHISLILFIVATLVFFFFLVRAVFIIAAKKGEEWKKYQLVWKIPVAIILPFSGLLVNGGIFSFSGLFNSGEIFGDFGSYWFYILAVANGTVICLPSLENRLYRLLLFTGRSITFAFTLYFFMVFLPFLPLSLIAVVIVGLGFLMLTPLLLMVIHVNELLKDWGYLKTRFPKQLVAGLAVLGFFVIPACITVTYIEDKHVLNQALSYVYSPNYSMQYDINKASLRKTLYAIKSHKDRGSLLSSAGTPYLSSYFRWIALDNLTLSDAKTGHISQIFFGIKPAEQFSDDICNQNVEITAVSTSCVYDTSQNAWRSKVDLEITNSGHNQRAEYATTLNLPEGCWISDYWLYVGNRKEHGILAEKKTAMWVFSNIRNENRDPGILYYLTGNQVAFRIFPFANDEIRRTGIEFLHKEPVVINIDNRTIELGNADETIYETVETDAYIYVPAQHKQTLKAVSRKPYIHFIVNTSAGKEEYADCFIKRIEKALKCHKDLAANAQISFVNTYINAFPLDKKWTKRYREQTFEGGFYLERGIQAALFDAHQNRSHAIIVVVTDAIADAILNKGFDDFRFAFPESDLFFNLNVDGNLHAHSLTHRPKQEEYYPVKQNLEQMGEIMSPICLYAINRTVLEYPLGNGATVYLPNNGKPSIILKKDIFNVDESEIKERNWHSALAMQAKWISQTLHPETSEQEWLNIIRHSFVTKVMTPVTSYIAVENEAQKAMLQKKQAQTLAGNKSLDPDSDTRQMSEPALWIVAAVAGTIVLYKRRRKNVITHK